jgi:hypothetical protein
LKDEIFKLEAEFIRLKEGKVMKLGELMKVPEIKKVLADISERKKKI